MLLFQRTMADFAYQLKFPCPECNGILTMNVSHGTGQCPLCLNNIEVNLDVRTLHVNPGESKLGWDRRAFRRPADTTKPIWQPLHPSAE
ncbi:MAG: hypothetical protein AB8F34_16050 [Akkermansiaceae bacterium]